MLSDNVHGDAMMKSIDRKFKIVVFTSLFLCCCVFVSGCNMVNPTSNNGSKEKIDQNIQNVNTGFIGGNNTGTNLTNLTSTELINKSDLQSPEEESTPVPPIATTPWVLFI
jgi:hypothetical protein